MIVQQGPWYIVAVHYPTAAAAKAAWERVERAPWRPNAAIGILRLSTQTRDYDPGLPAGRHPVIGCTHKPESAEDMVRELADGEPWTPAPDLQAMVIQRRVQASTLAPGTGRFRVRRPEPS